MCDGWEIAVAEECEQVTAASGALKAMSSSRGLWPSVRHVSPSSVLEHKALPSPIARFSNCRSKQAKGSSLQGVADACKGPGPKNSGLT